MTREIILPILVFWPLYLGLGALSGKLIEKVEKGKSGNLISLGYWFLLGAAGATMIEFLLSLIGIPFSLSLILLVPFSILGFFSQRNTIGKIFRFRNLTLPALLYWLPIISLTFSLFVRSMARVIYTWDTIAFWLPKMFSLWVDQTVNINALIHFNHPEYPLLLPIIGANAFTLMGSPNDVAVKAVLFGLSISLILILGGFLQQKLGYLKGLFFILIFFASFVVRDHLGGEYVGTADILLGTYLAAGVTSLLQRKPLQASIFFALTAWSKSEGLSLVISSFVLLFLFQKSLRRWLPLIGFLLVAPWFLYTKWLGFSSQYFKFSEIYARPWLEYAIYSVHAFREEFRNLEKWNLVFWFFFLASLVNFKKIIGKKDLLVVYGVLAFQMLMYLFIFTITPEEQASFIAAAISRITLHVAPSVLVVTSYLFAKGDHTHAKRG